MNLKIFKGKERLNKERLIRIRNAKDSVLKLAEQSFSMEERRLWYEVYEKIDEIGVAYYEALPRRLEVGFQDALSSLRKFRK